MTSAISTALIPLSLHLFASPSSHPNPIPPIIPTARSQHLLQAYILTPLPKHQNSILSKIPIPQFLLPPILLRLYNISQPYPRSLFTQTQSCTKILRLWRTWPTLMMGRSILFSATTRARSLMADQYAALRLDDLFFRCTRQVTYCVQLPISVATSRGRQGVVAVSWVLWGWLEADARPNYRYHIRNTPLNSPL